MKKAVVVAAVLWAGAAAMAVGMSAQSGTPGAAASGSPAPQARPAARAQAPAPSSGSAQPAAPARVQPAAAASAPSAAAQAADVEKHRAWVKQYCVACHNNRTAQPSAEPVNLETASLDDVAAHAETWERVLRKLSVRAMPPQGMPRPAEAQYAAFTTWLSTSL